MKKILVLSIGFALWLVAAGIPTLMAHPTTVVNMSVTPATYDFGDVILGQAKTQSFTITNAANSTAPLSISYAAIGGTEFSISPASTGLILPGHSATLVATYHPLNQAKSIQTWTIVNNSTNMAHPLAVTLIGRGVITATPKPQNPKTP